MPERLPIPAQDLGPDVDARLQDLGHELLEACSGVELTTLGLIHTLNRPRRDVALVCDAFVEAGVLRRRGDHYLTVRSAA